MSRPIFLEYGRVRFMVRLLRLAGRSVVALFDAQGGELIDRRIFASRSRFPL